MIWASVHSQSYFFLTASSFSIFGCKEYNQSDFSIDHLMMSRYSLLLCCWKRVFAVTSVFSWQNSVSLYPASFCTPRPNLPVTPGVSWLPTFAFQSPMMKRTSFWVLILEGFVCLHRTIQFQLLQNYWLGHRLGLLWSCDAYIYKGILLSHKRNKFESVLVR